MAYSLSGFALLGSLGETYAEDSQFEVSVEADGREVRKAAAQGPLASRGLAIMSWPNPDHRTGPLRFVYRVKVKALRSMSDDAVSNAVERVIQSQSGGSILYASASPLYGARVVGSSGGGGGGDSHPPPVPSIATSVACRARGGVCRDINLTPVRANEQVVRGLCTGASNIVCVVPRTSSSGGGGRPAPPPTSDAAPTFGNANGDGPDWGTISLIGGAVLLVGAVAFAIVKKRRSRSAVMQPARAANRRRNAVDHGEPIQVEVIEGSKSWEVYRYNKYQITDVQPHEHGAQLVLSLTAGRGLRRFVAYVRYRKHLSNETFRVNDAWGRGSVTLRVTKRMAGWTSGDLPLPEFTRNRRHRRNCR